MKRSKLWSGLTSTSAALLVVGLIGQNLAAANASYINTALGTATTKVVQTGEVGDTTYFKSQFGDFDDPDAQAAAIAAALEQNVNEMREGAALLRNENNTLPLTNATRISVFGHAAVDPAYQANSAGNKVTNGALNSIDLKTALEAQGFEVNPSCGMALPQVPPPAHRGPPHSGAAATALPARRRTLKKTALSMRRCQARGPTTTRMPPSSCLPVRAAKVRTS